jgi:hypothetical protein
MLGPDRIQPQTYCNFHHDRPDDRLPTRAFSTFCESKGFTKGRE